MAKNTKKENALAMFSNTNTVKPKQTSPRVSEKKSEEPKKVTQPKTEKKASVKAEEKIVLPEEPKEIIEPVVAATESMPSINFNVEKPEAPRNGHGKTIYLSFKNEEKLEQLAAENHCSISKYLNFLLDQILQ